MCVCMCMFVCMYVCNSLTSTETKMQEGLQWQLVAQCQYRFHNYDHVIVRILLNFRSFTLCTTADTACNALYCVVCLTLSLFDLHIIVIPVIPFKFRDVFLFTATCINSLSSTCFWAANGLCKEVKTLEHVKVFKNILNQSFPF